MNKIISGVAVLIWLATLAGCGQRQSSLVGTWTTGAADSLRQTFVFRSDGSAQWIFTSNASADTFDVAYAIDYGPEPHHFNLSGFDRGPLRGKVLVGLLAFDGDDQIRIDVEPSDEGSPLEEARPTRFTDQTVTYRRVR